MGEDGSLEPIQDLVSWKTYDRWRKHPDTKAMCGGKPTCSVPVSLAFNRAQVTVASLTTWFEKFTELLARAAVLQCTPGGHSYVVPGAEKRVVLMDETNAFTSPMARVHCSY